MKNKEHKGYKVPVAIGTQGAQRRVLCPKDSLRSAFFVSFVILLVLLSACKITEKNIAGTYYPENKQYTRLILKEDKTFELALLDPGTDSLFVPAYTAENFFTTGTWQLENKKLIVKCTVSPLPDEPAVRDSLARFTNISSFNFWNRYGDPVSIRYIMLPPAKPKPHYGNSLYYFAQDFKETDTLRFYLDGYPRFDFPGSIPPAIGNNIHKITLNEPYHPDAFRDMSFIVKKNKLMLLLPHERRHADHRTGHLRNLSFLVFTKRR